VSVKFTGTTSRISFTATPNFGAGRHPRAARHRAAAATTPTPPTTTTPQQGTGECTDWALYKRPDLRGKVTGNAQTGGTRRVLPVFGGQDADRGRRDGDAGRRLGRRPDDGPRRLCRERAAANANGNPTTFVISEQNWNGVRTRHPPPQGQRPAGLVLRRGLHLR
jgi:hypothetical protein